MVSCVWDYLGLEYVPIPGWPGPFESVGRETLKLALHSQSKDTTMRRALVVIYETLKLLIGVAICMVIVSVVFGASSVLLLEITKKPFARWFGEEFVTDDLYYATVGLASLMIAGIFLLGLRQVIHVLKNEGNTT
jgi:hypothetical protein